MTKIITLILESETNEDMNQVLSNLFFECRKNIKSIQIDEIKEQQLEVPKVFN